MKTREMAWNLWLQNAATYLRYALMEGEECAHYKVVFKVDNGLREWAIDRVNECIEKANEKYDDSHSREIAEPYIEALRKSGLDIKEIVG